jgi:Sulfotransferase family
MTERTTVGTVEDLHESASRLVGLDYFGGDEDNYREALAVILESYEREADLTPLGSKWCRVFLRGALVARLLSEAAWKKYPRYADVGVQRPIFITGLTRTGTTALHRLLNADPTHQGLQMWLAEYPQPRPPRETWETNPVYQQIDSQFERHHVEHPEFMGLHYMTAGEGVLAAAAPIGAFGGIRNTGSHPDIRPLAGEARLDAHVSAVPEEPAADRRQRRRQAVGDEEPQPPFRVGRVDGDLPRRVGGAVPSAGRDDHGLNVLAGRTRHGGLVEHVRRRADRRRFDGYLVAGAREVQRRTRQT